MLLKLTRTFPGIFLLFSFGDEEEYIKQTKIGYMTKINLTEMKSICIIVTVALLYACGNNTGKGTTASNSTENKQPVTIENPDSIVNKQMKNNNPDIADGVYRFDMSFAEKQGQSMGEQVTVIINGDSIRVVYEGDGNLKLPKGSVIDEGILLKHQSGSWIIAHDKKDAELEFVGGCSGGPTVVDLKKRIFLTC